MRTVRSTLVDQTVEFGIIIHVHRNGYLELPGRFTFLLVWGRTVTRSSRDDRRNLLRKGRANSKGYRMMNEREMATSVLERSRLVNSG